MEEKIAVKDLAGNITEISINVTTVVDKPTEPDIPIENLEVEVKYSTTKLNKSKCRCDYRIKCDIKRVGMVGIYQKIS